jgi:hypothetical protein
MRVSKLNDEEVKALRAVGFDIADDKESATCTSGEITVYVFGRTPNSPWTSRCRVEENFIALRDAGDFGCWRSRGMKNKPEISGHKTVKEIERYTAAAIRRGLLVMR